MTMTCAVGFFVLTCTTPTPAVPVARFCQVASLIRYAASDTAETRRQIRIANARYRAACGSR